MIGTFARSRFRDNIYPRHEEGAKFSESEWPADRKRPAN